MSSDGLRNQSQKMACVGCKKDSICNWSCVACNNFKLCNGCYEENGHPHVMTLMDHLFDQSNEGYWIFKRSKKKWFERKMAALKHWSDCCGSGCNFPACQDMKMVIQHTKNCMKRIAMDCIRCKHVLAIYYYHVKNCPVEKCPLQFCPILKQKINDQVKMTIEDMMMDIGIKPLSGLSDSQASMIAKQPLSEKLKLEEIIKEITGVPHFLEKDLMLQFELEAAEDAVASRNNHASGRDTSQYDSARGQEHQPLPHTPRQEQKMQLQRDESRRILEEQIEELVDKTLALRRLEKDKKMHLLNTEANETSNSTSQSFFTSFVDEQVQIEKKVSRAKWIDKNQKFWRLVNSPNSPEQEQEITQFLKDNPELIGSYVANGERNKLELKLEKNCIKVAVDQRRLNSELEKEFQKSIYPTWHKRMELAFALRTTEIQIMLWFQKRRLEWRKSEKNHIRETCNESSSNEIKCPEDEVTKTQEATAKVQDLTPKTQEDVAKPQEVSVKTQDAVTETSHQQDQQQQQPFQQDAIASTQDDVTEIQDDVAKPQSPDRFHGGRIHPTLFFTRQNSIPNFPSQRLAEAMSAIYLARLEYELEKRFEKNNDLSPSDTSELARAFLLTEEQVKSWLQNQREKCWKDMRETKVQATHNDGNSYELVLRLTPRYLKQNEQKK